jgi:hypothetical protein
MKFSRPRGYYSLIDAGDTIEALGMALARFAHRRLRPHRPRPRGATLRPGADTPLWLALVGLVRPHLRRRGAKALLARELGVDPSRITEFFGTRSAMPDAERALRLILWLRPPRWRRRG